MVSSSPGFVGGCFALLVTGTLSAAGGVGGGGMTLPLLLFVFGYDLNPAVRYSLCFVLGNANWQFLLNIFQPNPFRPAAPLVSIVWWELAALSLPGLLGGANLGSLLATIAPDSLRYLLALLLLVGISFFSLEKGIQLRRKEHEMAASNGMILVSTSSQKDTQTSMDTSLEMIEMDQKVTTEIAVPLGTLSSIEVLVEEAYPDESSRDAQAPTLPYSHPKPLPAIILVVLTWLINLILSIIFTKMDVCTFDYRVAFGTAFIPLLAFTLGTLWIYNHHPVEAHSLEQVETLLFRKIPYLFPLASFIVGILASLLGIGGGEVLIPLMLHFHIPPTIASGTASCVGFLNVFTLVIRALDSGDIDIPTGAVMYVLGASSGLSGRAVGLYVTSKLHKASVVVLLMGFVLLLSVAYYIYRLADEPFVTTFTNRCP